MNKEYTSEEAKAWLNGYDEGKKFVKKEWVGLYPKEISEIVMLCQNENPSFFAHAIEDKLKEKNT